MSAFIPTREQRRKYADYTVELRPSKLPVEIEVIDGVIYRWWSQVNRIPSAKKFVVYTFAGSTEQEAAAAKRLGDAMPRGEWARSPDPWTRYGGGGDPVRFSQARGDVMPDPLVQLELEMMIDLANESAVTL